MEQDLSAIVEMFFKEMPGMILSLVIWASIGALIGLVIAILVFKILRSKGIYKWDRGYGKLIRGLILATYILGMPFLFGLIGISEGGFRFTKTFLTESEFTRDVYPSLGAAGADLFGTIYIIGQQVSATDEPFVYDQEKIDPKLLEFQNEVWELDVPKFLVGLEKVESEVLDEYSKEINSKIIERYPDLKDTIGEKLVSVSLKLIYKSMFRKQLDDKLDKYGFKDPVYAIITELPKAAAASGSKNGITYNELSGFFVQRALAIGIGPLKQYVRGQQLILFLIALATLLFPPAIVFYLNRYLNKRKGRKSRYYCENA